MSYLSRANDLCYRNLPGLLRRCFALCILTYALGSVTPAAAAVLVSTLGQSVDGGAPFESTGRLYATDFLTNNAVNSLTKLTIQLANADSISHTLIGEIWSNSAGNPGSLLESFDSVISAPAFSDIAAYTASDAGIVLDPSTIYWLVLKSGENPTGQGGRLTALITSGQDVNAASPFSGVAATAFKIRQNSGDSFVDNSDFTPIYQLDGNAVPEPSSLSLLGIGGLALTAALRRRVAKQTFSLTPDVIHSRPGSALRC